LYRFIRFFSQKLCICIALNDTFLSIAAQHCIIRVQYNVSTVNNQVWLLYLIVQQTNHFIIAHWKEKHCLCQCTKMYLGLVQMNCAVYTPFYFFQIPDLLYIVRTIISHHNTHFTPSLWYIERNGDLSEASCPADVSLHSWTPPPPSPRYSQRQGLIGETREPQS
jgi:hypothetical protein